MYSVKIPPKIDPNFIEFRIVEENIEDREHRKYRDRKIGLKLELERFKTSYPVVVLLASR